MNKHEYAYENEAMLLGAILQDDTILEEITVQPKHFTYEHNRNMFNTMLELHRKEKEISFITLTSLPDLQITKLGGLDHIADVMNSTLSVSSFRTYEQNIKEFHSIEQARKIASDFLDKTKEISDISNLSTFLNKTTEMEIETVKKQDNFKQKLLRRTQQHHNSPKKGLSGINTGFLNINKQTDGWQNSELIIVAGRPSMGKTAFVLNSILEGCRYDDNIFATFFSIEMSEETVIDRLIATKGDLPVKLMRNPNKTFTSEQWKAHSDATGELASLNLDIRDERTVPEIRSAVRRNMKLHPDKKHVIAIDYLTLMKTVKPTGNRTYDVEEIITGLKDVAKKLNIPVIVLSQLSRGVESREDKRPNMGDLRDSGAIEQAADVIIMLYRDEYYKGEKSESKGEVELIFVKNRNGGTGTIKMRFNKFTNKFGEIL